MNATIAPPPMHGDESPALHVSTMQEQRDTCSFFDRFASQFSLSPWVRLWAAVLALLVGGAVTVWFAPSVLSGTQRYTDFIPGLIAFDDYYKSGELILIGVFMGTFFVSLTGAWWLLSRLPTQRERPVIGQGDDCRIESELGSIELVGLLLGILAARYFVLSSFGPLVWVPLATAAVFITLRRFGIATREVTHAIVLAPLLSACSVLSFITLYELILPGWELNSDFVAPAIRYSYGGGVCIGICALAIRAPLLPVLTGILQVPVPLLLVRFLAIDFVQGTEVTRIGMNQWGGALFSLFISLLILHSLRSAIRPRSSLEADLFVPTLVALAMFFAYGVPPATPFLADDFHLGEMMLPWQQIVHLGRSAFDQFVSIQGYLALTISFINSALFEGTTGTYYPASIFVGALLAGATAWLFSREFGAWWTLAVVMLFHPISDRFFLVPIMFLILCSPRLTSRPMLWCFFAPLMLWIGVLWNAAAGVALSIALLPIGFHQLYMVYLRRGPRTMWYCMGGALGVIAVLALLTPMRGYLTFILENGSTSLVAHGNKIFMTRDAAAGITDHFTSPFWDRLLFEGVRVGGWITVCLLLSTVLFIALRHRLEARGIALLAASTAPIIFCVVMLPQSMGRIDPPPYLSRTGALSMFALSFFLPYAYLSARRWFGTRTIPSLALGFLVGIPFAFRNDSVESIANTATQQVGVPPPFVRHAPERARPSLGEVFLPPAKISEIETFQRVFKVLLKPGETFVDFANRLVFHLIFDLPYPLPYPYVHAVNRDIQQRLIDALSAAPPAAVWISPSFEIDRGPPSLRAYRPWKWLLQHGYQYVKVEGLGFMVRPDRFAELPPRYTESTTRTEEFLDDTVRPELDGVPHAWGASYASLKGLIEERPIDFRISEPALLPNGDEVYLYPRKSGDHHTLELLSPLRGAQADYLLLEIDTRGVTSARGRMKLQWQAASEYDWDEDKAFHFRVSKGVFIVPVAHDPRWLLGEVSKLKFSLSSARRSTGWRITKLAALKLKEN